MAKFNRKIRRTLAKQHGRGASGAKQIPKDGMIRIDGGKQSEITRRLPEKGEMFVLAGPTFVSPVMFELVETVDADTATIRMVRLEDLAAARIAAEKEAELKRSEESSLQKLETVDSAASTLLNTLSELKNR